MPVLSYCESRGKSRRKILNNRWFLYESDGTRVGFTYNGADYYYTKNSQGDVTGIVDSNYDTVVQYSYDAWGKLLSTTGSLASTIGKQNPFLYCGYYYDTETGLYYLNSRYYDAQTGRFLNADSIGGQVGNLNSHNVFAYCENNPINRADPSGHFWKEIGDWFSSVGNSIKSTLNSWFGAGSTTVNQYNPAPVSTNGGLFSVNNGVTTTTTVKSKGNSNKPISVYSTKVANHPTKSTAGIKTNIKKIAVGVNVGLSNTGISSNYSNGKNSSAAEISFSLAEAKLKFNVSSTLKTSDNEETTNYSEITVNGDFVAFVILFGAGLQQAIQTPPGIPVTGPAY